MPCLCCDDDGDTSGHGIAIPSMLQSGDAEFVDESVDLVGQRFRRSPPAILEGVAGRAAGCAVEIDGDAWEPRRLLLDEMLAPIDASQANVVSGLSLDCVEGSFYVAGLNIESRVWLHVESSHGGPGAVPLVVGDELLIAGHHVVVEAVPHADDGGSDDEGEAAADEAVTAAASPSSSSSDEGEHGAETLARRALRRSLYEGRKSLRHSLAHLRKQLRFAPTTTVFEASSTARAKGNLKRFIGLKTGEEGVLQGELIAGHENRMSGRLSYDFRRRLLERDDEPQEQRAQLHLRVLRPARGAHGEAGGTLGTREANAEASAIDERRRLAAIAVIHLHNGQFWLVEAGERAAPQPQPAVEPLRLLAATSPGCSALPIGSSFSCGTSTFYLSRPMHEARRERGGGWERLAAALSSYGGAVNEYMVLPPWAWVNHGFVGRVHKKATLPLRDVKAKRRHATLIVRDLVAGSRSIVHPPSLCLQPHKGKPCARLLGRATQQLWPPTQLRVGDIFCLGRSHVRVVRCTRLARTGARADEDPEAATGGGGVGGVPKGKERYMLVEDTGKRYQRREKKAKRRERKVKGGDSSSSEDEEKEGDSDDERNIGLVDTPSMRLELVAGPWRNRVLDFGGEGASLGSSRLCTLDLASDFNVSSLHARINHTPHGEWFLSDCASGAGTFLLVPDHGMPIDVGDVVRIGNTEVAFYMRPVAAASDAEDGADDGAPA